MILKEAIKYTKENSEQKEYSLFDKETGKHIPSPSRLLNAITYDKFKDIPQQILIKAGEKGKAIHEAIENFYKNGEDHFFPEESISENYKCYYEAFKRFESIYKLKDTFPEVKLRTHKQEKYQVAGTIDMIGKYEDKKIIIDWKTSSQAKIKDFELQLTFYHKILSSHKINIDELWIVHLKKNKDYKILKVDMKNIENLYKICDSLSLIYNYKNNI